MFNLILNAIPFFLLAVVIEFLVLRHAAHDHAEEAVASVPPETPVGYELNDTRTSLTMGVGHAIIYSGWKLVMLAAYAGLYLLTPLRMDPGNWWVWVLLFFGDDLCYYAYHRGHHRIRLFWATHVTHHSSQHYNLSTALRQDWAPVSSIFFWAPLALLGFEPWMILLAISWNLVYQFWIHTERIRHMPRWFEAVFNTPSHHRVHHGSNAQYLDKNYAGILIIWDRIFGSFEPEAERVRYGLTKNIETFNPVRVAYHEFVAIWHDVRSTASWRERAGYMFRAPGWAPARHEAAEAPAPTPSPTPTARGGAAAAPSPRLVAQSSSGTQLSGAIGTNHPVGGADPAARPARS